MSAKALNIEGDIIPPNKRKKRTKWNKFTYWLEFDVWNSITYYCWRNPKRIVYNFIYFFKVVYKYRDFDYCYNFDMFLHSLERTANAIHKREIIVEHKETADSMRNFIRLYKRYIDDNYMEEAGCNWDNVQFNFEPIEGKDLFEMKRESSYTDEEMDSFRTKAQELREKDFNEMIEEFKKFEGWWD